MKMSIIYNVSGTLVLIIILQVIFFTREHKLDVYDMVVYSDIIMYCIFEAHSS